MNAIIKNLQPFNGQHCETTATGTLLNQIGIELSEPMLFGLGEGLNYIFWNMKMMDIPFIGGRIKPDVLTQNITKNLNLNLIVNETTSKQKAWETVKSYIDNGKAVGLKLDSFYLEYFSRPIHFAGHYVAIYGYNSDFAYLVDTQQQGRQVKTSLKSLVLARAEKGPMSSKNLSYIINKTNKPFNLKEAIVTAIKNNAQEYLHPPIANISYKGILKTSTEIIKWFKQSKNVESDFKTTALLMEKAGTGGALFRNLYRDFLKESFDLLKIDKLNQAYKSFTEIAALWIAVSTLFDKAGTEKSIIYLNQAADILKDISTKEKNTMGILTNLS